MGGHVKADCEKPETCLEYDLGRLRVDVDIPFAHGIVAGRTLRARGIETIAAADYDELVNLLWQFRISLDSESEIGQRSDTQNGDLARVTVDQVHDDLMRWSRILRQHGGFEP